MRADMDTDSSLQLGSPEGEPDCRLHLCLAISVNLRLSRFALWGYAGQVCGSSHLQLNLSD